jgi:hypothetical protein
MIFRYRARVRLPGRPCLYPDAGAVAPSWASGYGIDARMGVVLARRLVGQ